MLEKKVKKIITPPHSRQGSDRGLEHRSDRGMGRIQRAMVVGLGDYTKTPAKRQQERSHRPLVHQHTHTDTHTPPCECND